MLLLAMLVLFTGCGDDDDEGVKSLAQLEAKTVNCITTTDKVLTQGPKGLTFQAKISLAAGEEWCSFDPASQLATTAGRCGGRGAASLPAGKPHRRVPFGGDCPVNYSSGYSVTLQLWQMPYTPNPEEQEFNRAWGELPEYREAADYI